MLSDRNLYLVTFVKALMEGGFVDDSHAVPKEGEACACVRPSRVYLRAVTKEGPVTVQLRP